MTLSILAAMVVIPAWATDPSLGACDDPASCRRGSTQDSVLLQTARSTSKNVFVVDSNSTEPELLQQEMMIAQSPSQTEWQHFLNVKAERAKGFRCPDGTYYPPNTGEFEWDCRLWRAAWKWSYRQATEGFEGHTYGGSTSCKRTEAEGFPRLVGCGENLALGQATSLEAIKQLKKSKEHCKNFFDPSYNKLGSGFYQLQSSKFKYYWTDAFGDWHQAPDQSCIGGSPAPTPAPGCADIDTMNCQTYKAQGYCAYSPNVQAQCKDTCGIGNCGSPSPAPPAPRPPAPRPPPASSCEDTTGSCDQYRAQGYCQSSDNVRAYCKKTCGLCGGSPQPSSPRPSPQPTSGACQDTTGSCDQYRAKGYCESSENVRAYCKKTCGLCGSSQQPSPQPTSGACQDTTGSCDYYRDQGYCESSPNVKTLCKKTCGLC